MHKLANNIIQKQRACINFIIDDNAQLQLSDLAHITKILLIAIENTNLHEDASHDNFLPFIDLDLLDKSIIKKAKILQILHLDLIIFYATEKQLYDDHNITIKNYFHDITIGKTQLIKYINDHSIIDEITPDDVQETIAPLCKLFNAFTSSLNTYNDNNK